MCDCNDFFPQISHKTFQKNIDTKLNIRIKHRFVVKQALTGRQESDSSVFISLRRDKPGWSGSATLGIRHRIILTMTGIDGYGVPARNDIFANAMMFRECHCHHDAVRFCRNAVIAVAVMENVVRCVNPRVTLRSTLGCLTLAAPTDGLLKVKCFFKFF